MSKIIIRPRAEQDLDEHVLYIAQDNMEAALRLYDNAQESFGLLADQPFIGDSFHSLNPDLTDIRLWPMKNYRKYLIVYKPINNGVEIIRILHGSRDRDRLLSSYCNPCRDMNLRA